jgi:flagellar P-ring protein FlgI
MNFTRNWIIQSLPAIALCLSAVAQAPTGQAQAANTAAPLPTSKVAPVTAPVATTQPTTVTANALATANPALSTQSPNPVRKNRLGQTVLSPMISKITRLGNSMPHMLTGVGLVTGLPKTGSSDRGTRQAILNYIKQHNLNLSITDVESGATTLVALTCQLPPFAKQGQQLDVKAEILNPAESLRGGHLMRAELMGVDGKPYVVAQGALMVAGFSASGKNGGVTKNPSATAHILNGGLVIREENTSFFSESGALELTLLNPSPYNSSSIAAGISATLAETGIKVQAVDPAMVRLELPDAKRNNQYAMRVLGLIGPVRVAVENPTRVVIDQVSGTVLAGEGVLINPCVVQVSSLTISIVDEDFVSQPNPLSEGTTERIGRSRVEAQEDSTDLQALGGGGATVSDLLQNLKALGLEASQLVSVFAALDQGGFLQATLEVR